ncbi:hypothetical protein DFH08DRAFT_826943 [Mycena albidolilacea]|uniref:Uncharacterized protein n=1 Tax=Mycena albidolilacea TaxID=1033008 RepID=A0AAD6Z048_9AGAR|nr:hypothetical protein DFH08DRAFT_826943 [Mycena albidolilacea]
MVTEGSSLSRSRLDEDESKPKFRAMPECEWGDISCLGLSPVHQTGWLSFPPGWVDLSWQKQFDILKTVWKSRASWAAPGIDLEGDWAPTFGAEWGSIDLPIRICAVPELLGEFNPVAHLRCLLTYDSAVSPARPWLLSVHKRTTQFFFNGRVPPVSSITAVLTGQGDYYFQVSWIDFGWYTDGLGTCQYLQGIMLNLLNKMPTMGGQPHLSRKDNPSNPLNRQEQQNAGQEWILRQNDPLVDYLKDAFINQQPHSDIHAQREVMIEYRRISTAQGSSGTKWFQGWTSHQVTLGD